MNTPDGEVNKKISKAVSRMWNEMSLYSEGRDHMTMFHNVIREELIARWRPIKTQTRVIDPVRMMKGLLERGYSANEEGDWTMTDNVSSMDYIFSRGAWICCCCHPDEDCGWADWMLEEVEI